MTKPKKAILGLAAAATAHYLTRIQRRSEIEDKAFTGLGIKVFYTDFEKINQFLPDNYANVSAVLFPYMDELRERKISHLLIPNITLHQHFDRLLQEHTHYSFSLSHPLELTLQFLKRHHYRKIYILGTMYTMHNPYIIDFFEKGGIQIINPAQELQEQIEQLRKDNYQGTESPARLDEIISRLDHTIKPILACTELSTLNIDNSIIDMAQLQIEHFIHFMGMNE